MQPSSIPTYQRAWKLYSHFSSSIFHIPNISWPISPTNLGLFIAFMFQHHYAASTAYTYVSALGYCHRLAGFSDPTKVFWVVEMLKGYGKLGTRIDTRLPITLPILHRIIQAVHSLSSSRYRAYLLSAMFTTAFFAFLRIGEITAGARSASFIQLGQVTRMLDSSSSTVGFKIKFNDFKHSYNRPSVHTLSRRSDICPVQYLVDYISFRGLSDGPLFCTIDGLPIQRKLFDKILASVLHHCGLDSTKYKGHSFRTGAATFAAESGFSDAQIRALGRWKSDAFKKYIRTPSFTTPP